MNIPVHVGLHNTSVDSVFVVWPDNSYQRLNDVPMDTMITVKHSRELPVFPNQLISRGQQHTTKAVTDITSATNISYDHQENSFNEFDRESLIPHMVSTEGPAIAVSDINHDGRDDIFIGSSKGYKPALFMQNMAGRFNRVSQPAFDNDSTCEDVDAHWVDVNNDTHPDLIVASGGNEYYGQDTFLSPRVYINDGKANFRKLQGAFNGIYVNASSIAAYDVNGDGYEDVYIGGRSVPWEYGKVPRSYLLVNDGTGKFKDVTASVAEGLSYSGMVTGAIWFDIDRDNDKDLLLSHEWGTIDAWINNNGKLHKKILSGKKGWWNFVLPHDLDNDGDVDLIAGNLGLNSRLKASDDYPVKLYYEDFDGNGKKEQVVTYFLSGIEMPFTTKTDLEKQMPVLKKKFLKAEDFAESSLEEIFPEDKLQSAKQYTATYFANAVFINDGSLGFTESALPWQGQLSPFRDAIVVDANNDQLPDVFLVGNYYDNNISSGRYDADYGTILVNKGKGKFSCESLNGLAIKGQVRHIRRIRTNSREAFILVKNNEHVQVIRFNDE
jgi:enediyne biosynthesis protein E4